MKQLRNSVVVLAMAAFAAACADSTTAPKRTLLDEGVARQVFDSVQTYPFPTIAAGVVELCKISNVPGTFDFTVSVNGGQAQNVSISLPGTPCTTVFTSTLPNLSGSDVVVITENALPTGWATTINTTRFLGPNVVYAPSSLSDLEEPLLRRVTVRANVDMSRRVRFTNTFTAPPPTTGCTYTKGWYQNKNGAPTVIAVDGRTKAEAQTIFASTPGKPNGVTFGGNNLLHNLYQQLLAALNNLGGDANEDNGPPAVDAAIDAAQDGTGGSGLNITTTLTQTEMSALVLTLSQFNEGTFVGWPHCDD